VRAIAALLCVALSAHADPSPAPRYVGGLDVDQLDRDARRNLLAGNLVAGAGAVIGGVSTGLFITGLVRSCPAGNPGCNDAINTAGNWVGAGALVFVTVGITLFSVGMTQRKIVKQVRAR
jgi:hypothetical protein